ncbi:hypothetical protein CCR75_000741 [Bremia lactucae]|uniref:Uncharacterized protein n=1 Tax=Bremia lactucae TaxID=4779 RepID=A0A976NYL7_BRELC|nr:hypothetical protein CCR75_000741 [Bremia lactucae]
MKTHGRRKKRRAAKSTSQTEDVARHNFLQALEAQRANARTKKITPDRSKSAVVTLPGFYYDETKRRYFRCTPALKLQQRKQKELQKQSRQNTNSIPARTRRGKGYTWVAYMAQRQADCAWSSRRRDTRELWPKYLSNLVSSQVLVAQDGNHDGRLTALALHSQASKLGAVGASSGKLQILGLPRLRGLQLSSQRTLSICDYHVAGMITSLQWRPVQEHDLLVCHLGTAHTRTASSGSVRLLHISGHAMQTNALLQSSTRMQEISFVDPWIAKWNPAETGNFSIGYGGSSKAAYVDIQAENGIFQCAPRGSLRSDVHAQSFFPTGTIILNGTKCGGIWGWDRRINRRIFESRTLEQQSLGAIVDLHVLTDSRRVVIQRSSGELRLWDLRTWKPVVEFIPGALNTYEPHLHSVVDQSESVVVAGGDRRRPLAIHCYNLQHGRLLTSVPMRGTSRVENDSSVVQQVACCASHDGNDGPKFDVWAISRHDLYVGRRQMNEEIE